MDIYVPIDASPILTSGRNSTGAETNHPYINVLDNNMDTFFRANSQNNAAIYIDVGANHPSFDTIVIWFHNYNEAYGVTKLLLTGSSTDDIEAYTGGVFNGLETWIQPYLPVMIVPVSVVTKRYSLIAFSSFTIKPKNLTLEISGIWFCNKKTLSHEHQKPEQNIVTYHNRKNITKSGIPQNESAGIGSTSSKNRKFISTNDATYFDVLKDVYRQCQGNRRPFFMIPDIPTGFYHALNFTKPFADNEVDFQYHDINLSISDIGHEKIPFQNRRLYPLEETVGLWRFRDLNGTDDSGQGNDLTNNGFVAGDLISGGATEQGTTALKMNTSDSFTRSFANSTDFKMDMSDFTIEAWVLMNGSIGGSDRSPFGFIDAGGGWQLTHDANLKWGMNIGDGSTIFVASSTTLNDNSFNLITAVVDRTGDTIDWYIDGIFDSSSNISAVTGNVTPTSAELKLYGLTQSDQIWWDEICVTKRKLTADEILNRYNGREDLGAWGR